MEELVSVIIPVYKVEKYLERCVESVQKQTFQNLEIILVDDGSPDLCGAMCDEMAKTDPRIKVIHKNNGGLSDARNVGIEMASGNYIVFVDSDDWVEPEMFEALISLAKKYNTQIAMCGYKVDTEKRFIDEKGQEGVYHTFDALEHIIKLGEFNGYLWNKLFDASLFRGLRFESNISYCEDLLICVQCFMHVDTISFSTYPYYHYCPNENSLTKKLTKATLTAFQAREKIISLLPPELSSIEKAYYASAVSDMLYWAYEEKNQNTIGELLNLRKRYIKDFFKHRSLFPFRSIFRFLGSLICPPVFCRIWILAKKVFQI